MLRLFSHSDQINKALDASWLRNDVIANNISNVDTPNFKSSRVEFEAAFKKALDKNTINMKKTRSGHIDNNSTPPTARVVRNNDTSLRMDGNNVDIESEQINMVKNVIYYNTLVQKINKEFNRLKTAIGGRQA